MLIPRPVADFTLSNEPNLEIKVANAGCPVPICSYFLAHSYFLLFFN